MARWSATIIYLDKSYDTFVFDEFHQLGSFIERGPSWNTIKDISVALLRRGKLGKYPGSSDTAERADWA